MTLKSFPFCIELEQFVTEELHTAGALSNHHVLGLLELVDNQSTNQSPGQQKVSKVKLLNMGLGV